MAEGITTYFAQGILKELLRFAANEASLAWSFKGELEKLEDHSRMVAAFLTDAENRPSSSAAIQLWLKKLKGAVDDADAVLDEFQYELLRRKIEVRGRLAKKVTDFFSPSKNQLAFRLKLAHKIQNINKMLDAINKEAHDLKLEQKINDPSQQMASTQSTHPGVDVKSVVGRDEDVSIIVKELVSSSSEEDLPVISIIGMAGQGKTTLAQLVYRDDKAGSYFDKKIWVCVSNDFNVNRLLNEIAQSLTLTNPQLSSNDAIITFLGEKLGNKKYLLILDDIWNEIPNLWDSMRNALLKVGGPKGSKILVTSRSRKVAEIMHSSFTHVLMGLTHDESRTLFKQKAFVAGGVPETPELVEIGEQIVGRCGGLPLVISVIGSLLYSKKSKNEWLSVRDNKMWGAIGEISDQVVNNILKMSYDHLSPLSLKLCFAYTSILPKDSEINRDSIVQLWMGLGLLPSPEVDDLVYEDIGCNYFLTLLGKSLLQEANIDNYGNAENCKMHDLVHDLALQTSKGYCLTLRGSSNVNYVPSYVTHLTLLSPRRKTLDLAQGCYERLHTLFLEGSLVGIMLEDLKLLRVLVLIDSGTKDLPPSIGKLKRLRYLDVSRTSIRKLPSSITKLYNLQTLRVGVLEEILNKVENLVNLRHFYGGGVLVGIGKLTSLRTLQLFVVNRDQGCLVEELGGLMKLKGKLCIHGLGDIEDEEEANGAKLVDKSGIQALEFKWEAKREDGECNRHEDVLEGLRPHPELKSLTITDFKGAKLSSWMTSESFIVLKNLVEINLVGCHRCEQVPTLGHLPNLKKVVFRGLKKVKFIGEEFCHHHKGDVIENQQEVLFFPALRELVFRDMDMLEEWVDVKEVCQPSSSLSSSVSKAVHFPHLESLEISNCGNLMVVPSKFSSLKRLALSNVTNSRLELQTMSRGLTGLTQLVLWIVDCKLDSVLEELFKNNCRSLSYVYIHRCSQLIELPKSVFKHFLSLKNLYIEKCSNIRVVPDLGGLISLKELEISRCWGLNSLPSGIETLTSLQKLLIYNCPAVVTPLPDMGNLTKLEELVIGGFSKEVNEIPRLPLPLLSLSLQGWQNIQQLPQQLGDLFNLRVLYLKFMEGLDALPEWLSDLSSLQMVHVLKCINIKSMPTVEATRRLNRLVITDCPVLKERCAKGSGSDWHKIQHIPCIQIDRNTIQDKRSN